MSFKIHPCKAMPQENWGLMLQHDGICGYCGVDLEKEQLLSQLAAVTADRDKLKQDMHLAVSNAGKDLIAERDEALRKRNSAAASLIEAWAKADDMRDQRDAAVAIAEQWKSLAHMAVKK